MTNARRKTSGPVRKQPHCEVCGNAYDNPITIQARGEEHVFDCFECAIHALAPECADCGCKIIGHGVQSGDAIYCCVNCARAEGESELKDRK